MIDKYTFAKLILDLHDTYDFSITSWVRSREHNANVGGVADSQHIEALAVDVVFDTPGAKSEFVADAKHVGLEAIDEGTHFHVQVPR